MLPYLRSRGIRALDGMVVSRLDSDHSGGVASIVRGLPVRRLPTSIAPGGAALGGASSERGVAGQSFASGDLTLRVLHPLAADYERRLSTNAMSCVVRAQVDPTVVLLTGDLPAREEAALVAREPELTAIWLMAPQHGSRSSSSAALLAAVRPSIVLAQLGYRNRYGQPHPQIVARYAERGTPFTRTDETRAVQWRFAADGAVRYSAWRASAARYWHSRPAAGRAGTAEDGADDASTELEHREPLFGMP